MVEIKHLTISKVGLKDFHLDLVADRLKMLDYIDISYNEFNADSLLNFLRSINRIPNEELKLRWLNLAGNTLRTSSQRNLAQTMIELLLKPAIVHLDLTETDLAGFVIDRISRSLRYARTLQSLHLSTTCTEQAELIRRTIKQ